MVDQLIASQQPEEGVEEEAQEKTISLAEIAVTSNDNQVEKVEENKYV